MSKLKLSGGREIECELNGDFYECAEPVTRADLDGVSVVDDDGHVVLAGAIEVQAVSNVGGKCAVWLEAMSAEKLKLEKAAADIEYVAMMAGVEL